MSSHRSLKAGTMSYWGRSCGNRSRVRWGWRACPAAGALRVEADHQPPSLGPRKRESQDTGPLPEPPEERSPADTLVLASEASRGLPASPMVSGRYSEPLRLWGLVRGHGGPTHWPPRLLRSALLSRGARLTRGARALRALRTPHLHELTLKLDVWLRGAECQREVALRVDRVYGRVRGGNVPRGSLHG